MKRILLFVPNIFMKKIIRIYINLNFNNVLKNFLEKLLME